MILCSGEALIDMLPRQLPSGEQVYLPRCGGSVFNTSIALARLGAPTGFFGGLSTDAFGSMLCNMLQGNQVDVRYAVRSDRPTTLAFVELKHGQASYFFYDENTAARMVCDHELPRFQQEVSALFFGGISLATEPCAEAYATLLFRDSADRAAMLDFNVRPGFAPDEKRFRKRLERMATRADIIKASDEDLSVFFNTRDVVDAAHELLRRGAALVCLTEGSKGARGITARGEVCVAPPPTSVADTVGAGDTFNAGVLTALWEIGHLSRSALREISNDAVRTVISLGVRAAAVTASREGADPPLRTEVPAES